MESFITNIVYHIISISPKKHFNRINCIVVLYYLLVCFYMLLFFCFTVFIAVCQMLFCEHFMTLFLRLFYTLTIYCSAIGCQALSPLDYRSMWVYYLPWTSGQCEFIISPEPLVSVSLLSPLTIMWGIVSLGVHR